MATIISSREDDSGLYDKNRGYLQEGIEEGEIAIKGFDKYLPEGFVFNTNRVYDFTRSAKAKIREEMVTYLIDDDDHDDDDDDDDDDVWPGLREEDRTDLLEAFDCLFDYHRYKEYLRDVGGKRGESMEMFVFDDQGKEYVAHIKFSSTATRDADDQFTVYATLTCQRYTYFPLQKTDYEDVCTTLSNFNLK